MIHSELTKIIQMACFTTACYGFQMAALNPTAKYRKRLGITIGCFFFLLYILV